MLTTERTDRPMLSLSQDTAGIARLLEDRETARLGKLAVARATLARRIGCAPGTLESLRKGRLKRIEGWLHDKLMNLLVSEIEAEIRRLNAELENYRARGLDLDRTPAMAHLRLAVEQAQALIGEARP